MRIIPKTTKVKVTFYKGITVADMVIGITALALIAITLSSNFPMRGYVALGILCATVPLYLKIGENRLYISIAYLARYLFSRKGYSVKENGNGNMESIIPYRDVKGNSVYNRDGSVFQVIKIEPINFEMLSDDRQDSIIDGAVSRILNSVGTGEEFFLTKVEEPLVLDRQLSKELMRMDRLNDMKAKGMINDVECRKRMDICESRVELIDSLNTEEVVHPGYYLALLGHDPDAIGKKVSRILTDLEAEGIKAHRLNGQELHHYVSLSYGMDVDLRHQALKLVMPKKVVFYPMTAKVDDRMVTHLAIDRYPMTVPNGWAERLYSMPNTKVVMRIRPIEKDKAIRRIDNAILEIETKAAGKESEQLESDYHLDSLRELLEDVQQSNQTLFDTELIISVYDREGETTNRKLVKQALHEMGFGFTEMVGRQMDSFISGMVSTKEFTHVSHGIQTSSLAASFPFQSDTAIEDDGLFMGQNSLPAFIDFFKRDQFHVNSNMVIIGQSGSGKSYATKTLLTNLASDGCKVYVLDPEAEYGTLAESLGGVSIDASNGLKQRINPFEIIASYDEDGNVSNSYFTHLQFLEQFYRAVLPGISPDALEMLNKLTEEMYGEAGISPGRDCSGLGPKDYPTFGDLYLLSQKRLGKAQNGYEESCLRIITNYLARFADGGRDSALWNGHTTFSPKENFVAINFQKLIANRNDVTANAQMLLLLRWLENEVIRNRDLNTINHTDNRVVVAIDEAHLFIDEKYPIALDFMYSLAKRIRKYNGMLVIITQNVRDFAGTPETARKSMAIISVSQYSMIFSLSPNDMNELISLYENSGGFNETEKDYIVHSPRGECFLISSPSERGRLFIETTEDVFETFD